MNRVHPFPRWEWTPCGQPPDTNRRVLVWHRMRPYCRYFRAVVGWWNTREWRWDDSDPNCGAIYQPTHWKDIDEPMPF